MSNGTSIEKTVNLNNLYKEYIENVSILFFNLLFIEHNSKINIIQKFTWIKKKYKL